MSIEILRLGHRLHRDYRFTTHCGLVARAFGATKMYYSGFEDDKITLNLHKVNDSWGGNFEVQYLKNWRSFLKQSKLEGSFIILCTMYGENLPDVEQEIKSIKNNSNIIIVIGSEKIPSDLLHLSTLNVAISNQPHSEVAALAIILDRIFSGKQLSIQFDKARLKIVPKKQGKKVIYDL